MIYNVFVSKRAVNEIFQICLMCFGQKMVRNGFKIKVFKFYEKSLHGTATWNHFDF